MYDARHQFEPLLPSLKLEPLRARAAGIAEVSSRLAGKAAPATLQTLRELVRSMNSYYSNRIEGQGTSPLNIERALRHDFSSLPDIARLQRLAVAHIEAERALEVLARSGQPPLTSSFAIRAHAELYGRLPPDDRRTPSGDVLVPGALREREVVVGRHVPPTAASVRGFLARFDDVYGTPCSRDLALVALACAHHRIAWVHPFTDGNGRAARLQTHCALAMISGGLWSVNRGLARRRDEYYARLADADGPRRGALDGRGNLTEAGLVAWVEFFLGLCEDQVSFMDRMLALDDFRVRVRALVTFLSASRRPGPDRMRPQAELPLYHVFMAGSMTRADFAQMTGLGERTARSLLSYLLRTGLLVSDTTLGPVRLGLPLHSLQFLFPLLYPEAAQGEDDSQA